MNRFLTILTILTIASCGQRVKKSSDMSIMPFELILYDANYSLGYSHKFVLTNKDLKIIFKGELEGEKDTTLFETDLQQNEALKNLSNISIDDLLENYSNPYIEDGSQITVVLKKNNKTKTIHLSNYYQPDIGFAIEFINGLIPTKYKINYNKEKLLKNQE
jgi:hypothetical protein